jgi:prevent-host-death family protein
MNWTATEAKARLAELLRQAQLEPQLIQSRDRPIGVVLSYETYQHLVSSTSSQPTSVASFLDEVAQLKAHHGLGHDLELPTRQPVGDPPSLGG